MSELIGRSKGQAKNDPSDQAASGAEPHPAGAQPAAEAADLAALAEVNTDDAVVRRTRDGWRVGDADVPDLTSAMVLADLISAELAAPEPAAQPADESGTGAVGGTAASAAAGTPKATSPVAVGTGSKGEPQGRTEAAAQDGASAAQKGNGKAKGKSGRSKDPAPSEANKLRTTIGQLEHALTARSRVEQAIGVLAERHRIQPRQAFEQLRTAARNRGRRVIDIASDVVASATNPLLQLPDELSRPRAGTRQPRRNRQTPTILGSE
ncbi:MAG: ANTAR domain-containing protein [Streptosporangiaceae bacterium]